MSEQADLKGKTAIVTGASSGIGMAIAKALARSGAHTFLAGRTKSRLDAAVAALKDEGHAAAAITFDARNVKSVQGLVATAEKETGRLDIMVNNAGLSYPGKIEDGDPEHWREMLEVNVLGLLIGAQAAIKAMRRCKANGHIVNISSVAARSDGAGVYGATKAAVSSISRSLRGQLEDDTIRVVNISPGAVVTNFGRNFPREVIEGFMNSSGVDAKFNPGEHLPDEAIPKLQRAAKMLFASADDIARVVLFAITQPIELNVYEMEVRPQKQLSL